MKQAVSYHQKTATMKRQNGADVKAQQTCWLNVSKGLGTKRKQCLILKSYKVSLNSLYLFSGKDICTPFVKSLAQEL